MRFLAGAARTEEWQVAAARKKPECARGSAINEAVGRIAPTERQWEISNSAARGAYQNATQPPSGGPATHSRSGARRDEIIYTSKLKN
jgi:hypothetical protein